jgi:hypothetical protein
MFREDNRDDKDARVPGVFEFFIIFRFIFENMVSA